jgi:general secretion pathway protein D
VLSEMFIGGSSSAASLDTASNQVAPGSGLSATSSSDRLSLNSNNNNGASPNGFGSSPNGTGSTPQAGGGASGFGASRGATANGSGFGAGAGALDNGNRSAGGQPVLQGVRITADTVNNTLLIYADQENYRIIEKTVQQVDQPQLQVAIDATIAEVTLTDDLSYGVQSFLTSRNLGLKPDTGSILNTQATAAPAAATTSSVAGAFINRAFPGFNFLIGSEAQPSAILSALHAVTSVKVLSNPSLVVVNNQVATLQVGDTVPITTGTATTALASTVSTVDYLNTGIILRVSPRISVNGTVRLDVEQEISNVSSATPANSPLTPTISERKVKSSVSVATGQTVLLAGLISEQQNKTRNGIPLLDQIPGLGDGFSNQDKNTTRTELIIFIRPQIVRDGADAHFVAEELRSKLRGNLGESVANEQRAQSLH